MAACGLASSPQLAWRPGWAGWGWGWARGGSEPPLAKSRYKALQSVHSPETSMTESTPRYGFVAFAETWNGRLAMLGFVIGLGTELLTGQSILSQIGLG